MQLGPSLRAVALAAILICASTGLVSAAQPATRPQSVLLLLPGQPGQPAASQLATGVRAALITSASSLVSIDMEHADIGRSLEADEEARRVRERYRAKYGTQRFDLVMAAGQGPLRFVLRERDRLWPGVPVIVYAVDERTVQGLAVPPGVTVLTLRYDIEGTLAAALALRPETRHVALVGGAGPGDEAVHELVRQAVRGADPPLELVDLTRLPVDGALARTSTLPHQSIVLLSSYLIDVAGRPLYGVDVVAPFSRQRPAFTFFGLALGRGIVGGSLTDFEEVGREAGVLALRVLLGEPLPASRVNGTSRSAPRFDGRQLERWGLDERRLPAASAVLFREPTLWQRYRWHVVSVVGVIGAQAALIVGLLVHRRRRQEVQARLAEQLRFEALASEVVAACATVPADRIDDMIRDCLRRIGAFLGADRGALWQPTSDGAALSVTHVWSTDGVVPPPAVIDLQLYPYFRSLVDAHGIFQFRRPEDLPGPAAAERAAFATGQVRSFAAIPLPAGDRRLGYLAFVTLRTERDWPDHVVQQLQVLAEHFASALMRTQSAAAMESSAAIIGAVMAALPGETAILDATGTIVETNEAWTKAALSAGESQGALSVGTSYLDACRKAIGMPTDVARTVVASLEAILRGERDEFAVEYPWARYGEDRWFELRVRGLARLNGGAAVMIFDVSARRHAEAAARRHLAQIAHLDRVAGLGQLASSIAHELNQPLAAILVNAQAATRFLDAPTPDLDELRACLADIARDDQRAAEVIRRMRRLLKKTESRRLPVDLNELVASSISLVGNDALLHGVSIEFRPTAALPVVYGDVVQIQQVILNLLTNAVAAATAGPSPARQVSVWTAATTPPYVEVGVHDSGAGIAEADMTRLFEPFFTTKSDGLGMGLAISRSIVEAHDGHLLAANDLAGGATFRLHLRTDRD